jgi:hypothetical protein
MRLLGPTHAFGQSKAEKRSLRGKSDPTQQISTHRMLTYGHFQ